MAIALAEAAVEAGLEIVLLPAAYHRAGAGAAADAGPAALLRPERRGVPRARRRAARLGGGSRRASRSASPRTASGRCRRTGWRRSPPTPTRTASCATSTPTSRCASSTSAAPSTAARRSSCSSARASSARARASCTASTSAAATSRCWPARRDRRQLPDHRGQPRRRPPARAALPRRGRALAIGSDSQVRLDPFEEVRELETLRPPRGPDAPRAAVRRRRPVGRARARRPGEPRAAGGGRAHDRGRPRPPGPARGRAADLPLALATCASAGVVVRLAHGRRLTAAAPELRRYAPPRAARPRRPPA